MKIVRKRRELRSYGHVLWLFPILGALIIGILLGQTSALPQVAQIEQWFRRFNQRNGNAASLPVLVLDLPFENANQIEGQRQEALARGLFLAQDSDFVTADMAIGGQPTAVRLRLQPGPAKHLQDGQQWNYEVMTRDNQSVLGLEHFFLLDPADNNGVAEWLFNKTLGEEGLPALTYQFVRLIVNGTDYGPYALQQSSGPLWWNEEETRFDVVVGYDKEPLWREATYLPDLTASVPDPISGQSAQEQNAAAVATVPDPQIASDDVLSATFDRAASLLQSLQDTIAGNDSSGQGSVSNLLDIDQYGRFLALVDLFGATAVLAPQNARYIYQAEKDRLIPLSLNSEALSRPERISPNAFYRDREIQASYLAALSEISDPKFLTRLKETLDGPLQEQTTALGNSGVGAHVWDQLATRQAQLRLSLHPVQPILVYSGGPGQAQNGFLHLEIANTLTVPLEIVGFDMDGATFLDFDPSWITSGQEAISIEGDRTWLSAAAGGNFAGPAYVGIDLPVSEIVAQDNELSFREDIEIGVATRLPGLSRSQLTVAKRNPS